MAELIEPDSVLNGGSAGEDEGTGEGDDKDEDEPTGKLKPQECVDLNATPSQGDMMVLLPCLMGDEWDPACCNGLPPGARAAILPKCCP